MSNTDKDFMQKAFEIANNIDPHETTPNPRVGCVITIDDKIIAQGVHEKYGTPHAEQNAFKNATDYGLHTIDLSGSNIYITLEPCDHFHGKKTPSCTELLIEANPKKIFVGSLDPHFKGKNIEKIQQAGIEVEILNNGFHEQLNPFFKKYILTKKPYITLKVAQSLDGKISISNARDEAENSLINPGLKYITNKKSLQKVHEMRAGYSVILTTTKTILTDNPRLNTRLNKNVSNPTLIIVGKSHLPKDLKIFKIKSREIFRFDDFLDFWKSETIKRIDSIMTECGHTLNTYLLDNGFVDEINLFIAPKIIGDKNEPSFNHKVNLNNFTLQKTTKIEGDLLLSFIKKQA